MEKIETRGVIRFLHLKGYSAQQIYDDMNSVYGDEGPIYSPVTYWKRNFQTGYMSLTDEPRSEFPSLTITSVYYSTLLNKLLGARSEDKTLRYAPQRCPSPCRQSTCSLVSSCTYGSKVMWLQNHAMPALL